VYEGVCFLGMAPSEGCCFQGCARRGGSCLVRYMSDSKVSGGSKAGESNGYDWIKEDAPMLQALGGCLQSSDDGVV
jgi:hypothetical protein